MSLTNVIIITSKEWAAWLKRAPKSNTVSTGMSRIESLRYSRSSSSSALASFRSEVSKSVVNQS